MGQAPIRRLLAGAFLAAACAPAVVPAADGHSTGTQGDPCAPFDFRPASFGDLRVEQAAIRIHVDIAGVGRAMPLQLDTGSSETMLYEGAITAGQRTAVAQARTATVRGFPERHLTIGVMAGLGAAGDEFVGTAGTDLFPDGFVLDFVRGCLRPLAASDDSDMAWQPMGRVNGSPVLTLLEDGAERRVLLDTGSSAFTFLSTPRLSAALQRGEVLRTIRVPSFGRMLAIAVIRTDARFAAFGHELPLREAYAFADADIEAMLEAAGIDGLLGMRSFTNGALAFDFAGGRIGFDADRR